MLSISYKNIETVNLPQTTDNPKHHDMLSMIASFQKYGFKDAPIYDDTAGSVIAGTGRVLALLEMKAKNMTPPLGIIVGEDNDWKAPFQVGVDSKTKEEALSFIIDHNNIVLMGGGFTAWDMSKLWDTGYLDLLIRTATNGTPPITVTGDDIDIFINASKYIMQEETESKDSNYERINILLPDVALLRDFSKELNQIIDENPQWNTVIK